jgi:hypothetical protein
MNLELPNNTQLADIKITMRNFNEEGRLVKRAVD